MWETLLTHADQGCFKILILRRDLEDSKSTSEGVLCISGSQTFVPLSWMCKKQTSVSHSSTEAELISLDAGLRMDGIPVLDLWDLVMEVFHCCPIPSKKTNDQPRGDSSRNTTSNKHTQNQTKVPTKHNNLELSNVDYVSSNAKSSLFGAVHFIFEDNEAVIKMIMKGRSPTMRHVSMTHRVALDWLFDRINLDPKIQIRYLTPKANSQTFLAKGNFTRDEWNHLLHLFNISHFSSTCYAENSSLIDCSKKMAKRVQEQKEEEIIVAKIKTYSDELVFTCSDKFLIRERSDCIQKRGATHSFRKPASRVRRNSKPDAASSEAQRCLP